MSAELSIHGLGPQGDGVHRSERGPIFVEGALPGESVETEIQPGPGGVLRGKLLRVLQPSSQRINPPCPYFEACGGCTLQHADEALYREWKLGLVRGALRKINIEPGEWLEPTFALAGARRRATFGIVKRGKTVLFGFFRRRTHRVTDIENCLIVAPVIMQARTRLIPLLTPLLQENRVTDVFIQTANSLVEIVITGPIGKKGRPDLEVHEAMAQIVQAANIARVSWRANERDIPEIIVEASPLHAAFGVLRVALPPLAFLQPTSEGESALVAAVMGLLPESGKFADLFSGCGTFSGPMLERGAVDAFESNEFSVHALSNAQGARRLKAQRRDLYRNPLQPDELNHYGAIVLDPPRAGAQEQAKAIAQSSVPVVIGVSCNPATFARDALILREGGYRLNAIKVIDQFIWSHHVELVASFSKLI